MRGRQTGTRALAAGAALLIPVLGLAGFSAGHSGGKDIDAARADGTRAGEEAAAAKVRAHVNGAEYRRAYKAAYDRAYEAELKRAKAKQ